MAIPVTTESILFVIAILSVIFNVYQSFTKPQNTAEKDAIKLADRVTSLENQLIELRGTHIVEMEKEIKSLNASIQDLSKTVIRLSTIIDERIPKATLQK